MSFQIFKKESSARTGFTLIELLVVIAIIGLLASIVLASLNSARTKSRDTRRLADIKQIQVALEFYFDGVGNANYPVSTATCDATANQYGLEALSANGYMPAVPRDPQSTSSAAKCYKYAANASSITSYHLGAGLEDAGNQAFNGDKDCRDDAGSTSSNVCPGATAGTARTNGFDGTTDATNKMYDVVP